MEEKMSLLQISSTSYRAVVRCYISFDSEITLALLLLRNRKPCNNVESEYSISANYA